MSIILQNKPRIFREYLSVMHWTIWCYLAMNICDLVFHYNILHFKHFVTVPFLIQWKCYVINFRGSSAIGLRLRWSNEICSKAYTYLYLFCIFLALALQEIESYGIETEQRLWYYNTYEASTVQNQKQYRLRNRTMQKTIRLSTHLY